MVGSQFIGMAKKLIGIPIVNKMFELANSVFKKDLLGLCLTGPKNELDKTVNCQAVIYVTSLAAIEKLKLENIKALENCKTTAGFSVGEYASLVLSGVITFEDGMLTAI
jgi:[acyl-carrier-protein] S-malonyltransferase